MSAPDGPVDGRRFLRSDGSIRSLQLLGLVVSALVVAATEAQLIAWDAFVGLNVWAVATVGAFLEDVVAATLQQPALVQAEAWRLAAARAIRFGPLGPFLLVAEALLVAYLFVQVRQRGPL